MPVHWTAVSNTVPTTSTGKKNIRCVTWAMEKCVRTADQQAIGYDGTTTKYATAKIISINNIQPGDLVFYYQPISHVGLYIGNGLIVHASTEAAYPVGGIKTSPFDFATIRAIVRYW